jgi:hypothetical protein
VLKGRAVNYRQKRERLKEKLKEGRIEIETSNEMKIKNNKKKIMLVK